jgi:C4-dicarboxylate-specific signal transduction histidine kinase
VDLNEMCRTSARLLQYDARTRRAQITLSLDPHLPPVTGDPVQFQQVVLNLILNALDASAATPNPHVVISTAARGEEVEVAVRDNGPGLTEEVQQHLFESFFTTKTQGLGAENAEHGGAIFRVVVPVGRSPRPGPADGATELGGENTGVELNPAAGQR